MARYSTGCRDCVRRHIRCDEAKPACKNCIKNHITCGGSKEGAHFVIQRQSNTDSYSRMRNARSKFREPLWPRSLEMWGPVQSPKMCPVPSAYDREIFIGFLRSYWELEDRDWIEHCALNTNDFPTANIALDSLAAALYSKRHRDPLLMTLASRNYGEALFALRNALQKDDGICNFDILAACTALHRYETIVCTSRTAYIQHAGGLSRVTELGGPGSFREYPNKSLLRANGYRIVHEAYYQRRRSFLEQHQWKLLEVHSEDEATHFLKLLGFWARLAGVAQEITVILIGDNLDKRYAWQVCLGLKHLLADLDEWEEIWTNDLECAPVEKCNTDLYAFYSDEHGILFRSSLEYPSLRAAMGYNFCRGLRITLLKWAYKFENPAWWAGEKREGMIRIPMIREIANDMCRCLHAQLPNEGGQEKYEMFTLIFTARNASKPFHENSREARWINKTLADIADWRGYGLGRDLDSMNSTRWPGTRSTGMMSSTFCPSIHV